MESEVRDLGILIDSNLNFSKHVELILSKVHRSLYLLKWIDVTSIILLFVKYFLVLRQEVTWNVLV